MVRVGMRLGRKALRQPAVHSTLKRCWRPQEGEAGKDPFDCPLRSGTEKGVKSERKGGSDGQIQRDKDILGVTESLGQLKMTGT